MRRLAFLALAALFLASGPPAAADEGHPVDASPATDLLDGATVTVSAPAGAFPAGTALYVLQCSNDPAIPLDATGLNACSLSGPSQGYYTATAAADGSVPPLAVTVHTGQLGIHPRSVCPPVEAGVPDCGVMVTDASGTHYGIAPLRFAAIAPPSSTATTNPATVSTGVSEGAATPAEAATELAHTGPDTQIARWLALGLLMLHAGFLSLSIAGTAPLRRR